MSAMRGVGGKEGPSTSRCFRVINFMPSAFEAECTNFVRNVENSGAMRQNVTFYDIFLIKAKTVLSLIKSVPIDEYVDIYQSDPCYISSGLNVKPIHNRLAGLTVILRIQRSGMLCAFYLSCFSVVAFSLTRSNPAKKFVHLYNRGFLLRGLSGIFHLLPPGMDRFDT